MHRTTFKAFVNMDVDNNLRKSRPRPKDFRQMQNAI
jgi:hypothetical protein